MNNKPLHERPFFLRRILLNTTPAYVWRVWASGFDAPPVTERLSILGWRLTWEGRHDDDNLVYVYPIVLGDNFDDTMDAIDFIVDHGVYRLLRECDLDTEADAMKYAKDEFRKRDEQRAKTTARIHHGKAGTP